MRPTAKVVLLCILNAVDSDRKKKKGRVRELRSTTHAG